jgi:hypothetical protein
VVVRGVRRLGDLLGDNALLPLHLACVQRGAEHKIARDLGRERQAVLEGPDLEAGALVAGGRVDGSACVLDGFRQSPCVAGAGALEHHVLQEVAPAGAGGVLPTRAAAHHDREREGFEFGLGIDGHADPVGQPMEAGAHARTRFLNIIPR